jgi:hypothetical protein
MAAVDGSGQPYMGVSIEDFVASLQEFIEAAPSRRATSVVVEAPTIQLVLPAA